MRGLKSALVAVSALLIGGGVALAQSRFDELQRTYDESDRTLECCSQRWAQLDEAPVWGLSSAAALAPPPQPLQHGAEAARSQQ